LNTKYEEKAKEKYLKDLKEEDKKQYYKGMKSIKHVLIKTVDDENNPLPAKEIKKANKKAKEVLKQAKEGVKFEKLIKDFGEDEGMLASPDGYLLGEYDENYVKPFKEAGLKLKPGKISGIVETIFGYHILKAYSTTAKNFTDDVDTVEGDMWNAQKEGIFKKATVQWKDEKINAVPVNVETDDDHVHDEDCDH